MLTADQCRARLDEIEQEIADQNGEIWLQLADRIDQAVNVDRANEVDVADIVAANPRVDFKTIRDQLCVDPYSFEVTGTVISWREPAA